MRFRNVLRPYLATNIATMTVQIRRRLANGLCEATMISTSVLHVVYRSHPSCFGLPLLPPGLCSRIHLPIVQRPDTRSISPCSAIIYCSSPFPPTVSAAFIFFSLPVCFPSTVFPRGEVWVYYIVFPTQLFSPSAFDRSLH